jgi:hypothetical protein
MAPAAASHLHCFLCAPYIAYRICEFLSWRPVIASFCVVTPLVFHCNCLQSCTIMFWQLVVVELLLVF